MAEIMTQISVFLKNVPGTLHQVLKSITDAQINIEAIMVSDAVDHAVVRLVVDLPQKAIHLLGEHGLLVIESDIIAHEMPNEPGELLRLAGALAKGKINISYIYGSTPREGGIPRIYLQTSDNKKVARLLNGSRSGRRRAGAKKK
jgi:hypothetical protein